MHFTHVIFIFILHHIINSQLQSQLIASQTLLAGRNDYVHCSTLQIKLELPKSLAFTNKDNLLYIADTENHLVRIANLETMSTSVLAGTGQSVEMVVWQQMQHYTVHLELQWIM